MTIRRQARIENQPLASLRGFAAIWVIFSHLTPAFAAHWSGPSWRMLRDGYMGVDVFFVLSGFILGLVYRDLRLAGTPSFFLRRILRLYPLNIAILIVLATLSWTIMPVGSWADPRLLPLFILMLEGYRSTPVPAWNPVTWSVGIELACYACFPLVIVMLRRLPGIVLAVLAILLLATSWWVQGFCLGWPVGWHGLARGMSSFWPGVVLATLVVRWPECPARWASIGEMLVVAGLFGAVAFDDLRLVPVLTGGLVVLFFFDAGVVARLLHARWCFWMGEISFSIYMLFGLLLPRMMGIETWLSGYVPHPVAIPLFIVFYLSTTLALAHVTYVVIECPFRRMAWPRRVTMASASAGD